MNQKSISGAKDILFGGKNEPITVIAKYVLKIVEKGCLLVMVAVCYPRKLTLDCRLTVHHQCLDAVTLPCFSPANFSPDRVRAAFLRCFASLLCNYRRALEPIPVGMARPPDGRLYNFRLTSFLRVPSREMAAYLEMLAETQAFNEFIIERCLKSADDPEIALFDQFVMAKRNRGRHGIFRKQRTCPLGFHSLILVTPFLSNSPPTVKLETRKSVPPNDFDLPLFWQPPRTPPSKLDSTLLLPPRLAQPHLKHSREKVIRRKPVQRADEKTNPTQSKTWI
jgi:hypothetical protein